MLSEATFYGTIFVPIFQVFAEARGAAKRIWEILDSTVCSYNQHKKKTTEICAHRKTV